MAIQAVTAASALDSAKASLACRSSSEDAFPTISTFEAIDAARRDKTTIPASATSSAWPLDPRAELWLERVNSVIAYVASTR